VAIDYLIADELWMPTMQDVQDRIFRSLADPTRRAIFERLCREGELTVGKLTAGAGVSQPVVSKHLGVLKQAGLVSDRHQGRQTHYTAQVGALGPLVDWTKEMTAFWESRIDDLEILLKRRDQ
jgi:DNA-binding transcriptional ArsR family regulator